MRRGALKFIHITDTHLVPPGQTLCALDPAQRLRATVNSINRLHGDARFVLSDPRSKHAASPGELVAPPASFKDAL